MHACMLHVSHLSDLLPVDVPVCTRQLYQSHPEAETILIHHTEPIHFSYIAHNLEFLIMINRLS